jgi:MoaA/NifB/PqqE/SkfB family radical SAM enzyme
MTSSQNPYSNSKILWHPQKLEALRSGKLTAPIYVRIKPTNHCNHRCFYCSYADTNLKLRKAVNLKDEIPWSRLKKAISDMAAMKVRAVTFSGGGEPLVYPSIKEAFTLVKQKKMDLSLITNGQLLKGKAAELLHDAKWVRISLDSPDAKTFSQIRGVPVTHFVELLSNIRAFAAHKKSSCELGINFVINDKNASYVYAMAKLMKSLGVNHVKYTARITKDIFSYHKKFKDQAIAQIHKAKQDFEGGHFKIINKYEDDFRLSMVFERSYSRCPMMQIVTIVAADSKVYLCHDKAYVPGGELGDLAKESFREIWFSKKTKELFDHFNAAESCRHHCVYDERNLLINELLEPLDKHGNFI